MVDKRNSNPHKQVGGPLFNTALVWFPLSVGLSAAAWLLLGNSYPAIKIAVKVLTLMGAAYLVANVYRQASLWSVDYLNEIKGMIKRASQTLDHMDKKILPQFDRTAKVAEKTFVTADKRAVEAEAMIKDATQTLNAVKRKLDWSVTGAVSRRTTAIGGWMGNIFQGSAQESGEPSRQAGTQDPSQSSSTAQSNSLHFQFGKRASRCQTNKTSEASRARLKIK